jgi:cyclophilin family peptidyl-prolyl cis-trans isomerase
LIKRTTLPFLCAMILAAGALAGCDTSASANQVAVLETSYGRIVFEFLPEYAPRHVQAFSEMIDDGELDGTRFHRVIPNRVIQGGDPNSKDDDPSDDGLGQPGQPTIPAEFSTAIKHTRGIVSAARKGNDPNSATSQFFICAGNEAAFDGQYSIFGRVIDGMNVVDLIARAPLRTDDPKLRERPVDPVVIKRAYLSTRDTLGLAPKEAAQAAK